MTSFELIGLAFFAIQLAGFLFYLVGSRLRERCR